MLTATRRLYNQQNASPNLMHRELPHGGSKLILPNHLPPISIQTLANLLIVGAPDGGGRAQPLAARIPELRPQSEGPLVLRQPPDPLGPNRRNSRCLRGMGQARSDHRRRWLRRGHRGDRMETVLPQCRTPSADDDDDDDDDATTKPYRGPCARRRQGEGNHQRVSREEADAPAQGGGAARYRRRGAMLAGDGRVEEDGADAAVGCGPGNCEEGGEGVGQGGEATLEASTDDRRRRRR